MGNIFSAKSISGYLKSEHRKIDNETVYSYLEKLEKTYLLHRCSRYDLQRKEILKTQGKDIPQISDEAAQVLGDVCHCTEYALWGSPKLTENCVKALGD